MICKLVEKTISKKQDTSTSKYQNTNLRKNNMLLDFFCIERQKMKVT